MVDIATRHAPPPSTPLVPGAYALAFAATAGLFASGAKPAWVGRPAGFARFPQLPVAPVVPVKVGGFTVLPVGEGFAAVNLNGAAPVSTPTDALRAVAEYALWWYERDRQTPGLARLPPPVLADAAVQDAYWKAPGRPSGYASVGDWRHFAVVESGWPLVPDATPQEVEYVGEKPSPVFAALTQAVQDKVPISALVPQVTDQLNSLLAAASGRPSA